MDNIQEQLVNISKAHAFDIVSAQVGELKEQNAAFRKAIMDIWRTLAECDVTRMSAVVKTINEICKEVTSKNRPL